MVLPQRTTRPTPLSGPNAAGRKKLVFISTVGATCVIPEATMQATDMHSSSMAHKYPPWTCFIGLETSSALASKATSTSFFSWLTLNMR